MLVRAGTVQVGQPQEIRGDNVGFFLFFRGGFD